MQKGKTHSMHNRNAAAVKIPRKKYQVKIPIENASIPLSPLPYLCSSSPRSAYYELPPANRYKFNNETVFIYGVFSR